MPKKNQLRNERERNHHLYAMVILYTHVYIIHYTDKHIKLLEKNIIKHC